MNARSHMEEGKQMLPDALMAENINIDGGLLWTVLAVLLIICAVVWLFRALR